MRIVCYTPTHPQLKTMELHELDNRTFAFRFNQEMIRRKKALACAESITAGLLASTLASAPGTLDVLKGSVVVYTPVFKEQVLGVPRQILETYSAESQQTTDAMLEGLKKLFPNAPVHVAVTGLAAAGPGGPMHGKEPGQIYLSIAVDGNHHRYDTIIRPPVSDEWGNAVREATVRYILTRVLDLTEGDA